MPTFILPDDEPVIGIDLAKFLLRQALNKEERNGAEDDAHRAHSCALDELNTGPGDDSDAVLEAN